MNAEKIGVAANSYSTSAQRRRILPKVGPLVSCSEMAGMRGTRRGGMTAVLAGLAGLRGIECRLAVGHSWPWARVERDEE